MKYVIDNGKYVIDDTGKYMVYWGPGDASEGGVIGYIFQPGDLGYIQGEQHGLIFDINNLSEGIASNYGTWGCSGTLIGANDVSIGYGQINTTKIVNGCATANIAARLCDDSTAGGKTDWFLPTMSEWDAVYSNKSFLHMISGSYYWSSNESLYWPDTYARLKRWDTGLHTETGKNEHSELKVKAFRYF